MLGNREVVVKVMKILDEMDVKAPQVMLSTVIGELSLTNNDEFGVSYFLKGNDGRNRAAVISRNSGGVLLPSSSPSENTGGGIFNPASPSVFTQLANIGTGLNVYLAAGDRLLSVVRALQASGRFKTISRPTVFTTNNKKAIIASGREIPVPVSTISSGTGNVVGGLSQQSNIQFKKVALQLEVVPLINSEKEVSLDILQKVDSVAGFTTVDNNEIPNIATRYIKTTVSAPNCSTLVLGGLIMDDQGRDVSGIPILSKIPWVGGLFRNTTKTKSRQELIVLMRPEVTLTKLDVMRLKMKNADRTHFGAELEQDDCPDCPKSYDGKQLPMPDLPAAEYQ